MATHKQQPKPQNDTQAGDTAAAASKEPETAKDQDEGTIVYVTASSSRRRIGRRFPAGQKVPVNWDKLSEKQQQALVDDTVLHLSPKPE